jgi:hypothetical protein
MKVLNARKGTRATRGDSVKESTSGKKEHYIGDHPYSKTASASAPRAGRNRGGGGNTQQHGMQAARAGGKAGYCVEAG